MKIGLCKNHVPKWYFSSLYDSSAISPNKFFIQMMLGMKGFVNPFCSNSNTDALGNCAQCGERKKREKLTQKWIYLRICVFVSLRTNFLPFLRSWHNQKYIRCVDSILWAHFLCRHKCFMTPKMKDFHENLIFSWIAGKLLESFRHV